MSYEYDVPYVDFITAFGKDDDADKFFDVGNQLESLTLRETSAQERKNEDSAGRCILQEITDIVAGSGILQNKCKSSKNFSCNKKSNKEMKLLENSNNNRTTVQKLKTQHMQGFLKPTLKKNKKLVEVVEEVDGDLCIQKSEAVHCGVPRIPSKTKAKYNLTSFEERQQLQIKRKEENVKKFLAEEQKKREFHAKPVPSYLRLNKKQSSSKTSNSVAQRRKSNVFKARPAFVIRKPPFLPKKPKQSIIKPLDVTLHSEKRAKERKEFEERLKQRLKQVEEEAQVKKELLLKQEKQEIAELRRRLVHKAQPVPSFKNEPRFPISKPLHNSKSNGLCSELKN